MAQATLEAASNDAAIELYAQQHGRITDGADDVVVWWALGENKSTD